MAKAGGYVELTVKFAKEGDRWTAECLELGTAAYGNTFDRAATAISDLVLLHLNALEDVGTQAAFFKKHGIRFHKAKPVARRSVQVGVDEVVKRTVQRIPVTV